LLVFSLNQNAKKVAPFLPLKISSGFKQDFQVLNFTFNFSWPEFGKEVPLPKVQNDEQELENKAEVVAKKLGFATQPKKRGELFEWKETNYLSFSSRERRLYFGIDALKNPAPLRDGPKPDEETAKKTLETTLANLGLQSSNQILLSTEFSSNIPSEGIRTKTKLDADVIEFNLGYQLNGLEVIQKPKIPPVKIGFGHQNQLVSLDYTFIKKTESSSEKGMLISQKEALSALSSGLGTVVFFEPKFGRTGNIKSFTIKNATIDQVKLKYYQTTKDQGFLLPIFEFSGNATLTTGESGEIILFLPAVKKTSLKF
jgi:hypothetical protein